MFWGDIICAQPELIKELEIGFNPAEKSFGWMIRNIRVFYTR